MSVINDYLDHGWALTPLRPGTKKPIRKKWAERENAITTLAGLNESVTSVGLLLAYCAPPLMTLDVDEFYGAAAWLNERGIDLAQLFLDPAAVQIVSGQPNRGKLLYQLDVARPTQQIQVGNATILEFRCGNKNGGSMQDVLPPSLHPKTRQPYQWEGDWRNVPAAPPPLIALWDSLISNTSEVVSVRETSLRYECSSKELRETIKDIDPNPEPVWWKVIAAATSTQAPNAKEIVRSWSRGSEKHTDDKFDQKWNNTLARAEREPRIGIGTIKRMARETSINSPAVNTDEPILRVNDDYAWVRHGGGHPVMEILHQARPHEPQVAFMSKANFLTTFKNKPKVASEAKLIDLGNYWLGHPARREYRSVVFDPTAGSGTDVGDRYNLFQGWAVEPIEGDCDLFLDFIQKVICNHDTNLYQWLIKWCAHIFQHPGDKPGTAPVFQGGQGVGKNTFMDTIGALLGRHYVEVDSLERLFGRFNFGTADKLLVVANEALWGGDKRMLGQLKSFVTEPYQTFEQKGVDSITMPSYTRLMLASNERHPVHIDTDDRRFVFFEVNPEHARDERYFKPIRSWREDNGLAHLLYHLQAMDLTEYSPRVRPSSGYSQSVAELSMSNEQVFWKTVLNEGEVPLRWQSIHDRWVTEVVTPDDPSWLDGMIKDSVYGAYVEQIRPLRGHAVIQKVFFETLYQMLQLSTDETHSMGRGQIRTHEGNRVRVLKLMPLAKLRARYAKATGHVQEWAPVAQDRIPPWEDDIPF